MAATASLSSAVELALTTGLGAGLDTDLARPLAAIAVAGLGLASPAAAAFFVPALVVAAGLVATFPAVGFAAVGFVAVGFTAVTAWFCCGDCWGAGLLALLGATDPTGLSGSPC